MHWKMIVNVKRKKKRMKKRKPMSLKTLQTMLTYKRPAWSNSEEFFIERFIDPVPGMYADKFGNRILPHPSSRLLISCHTDTVHWDEGRQKLAVAGPIIVLPTDSKSNCLGADCTAGVYTTLRMIEAGIPATYIFHRAEEIGGLGSEWLASHYAGWLAGFDICLALDRRGTSDIITSQWGGPTASQEFASSLSEALGMNHAPARGTFTDSANYAHLIPECSNLSIGYQREHSCLESLDTDYLERVTTALCNVPWGDIVVARDPFAELEPEPLVTPNTAWGGDYDEVLAGQDDWWRKYI